MSRREPPPLPRSSGSDSDGNEYPPAVPERRSGKSKVVKCAPKKPDMRKWADERQFTIGYADIDAGPSNTPFVPSNDKRTSYALLQYPGNEKQENEQDSDCNVPKTSTAFSEIEETDELSSYDTPLPVLVNSKTHKNGIKENGLQNNGFGPAEDPFAFDPFQNDPFQDSDANKVVCQVGVGEVQEKLPPSKSRSTEDVLNSEFCSFGNYCKSASVSASNTATMPRLVGRPGVDTRVRLEARKSWSAGSHPGLQAGSNAFSNPTYDGVLDPSLLEGKVDEDSRQAGAEAIQFYEEDFQILEAQGYSREAIKRALIVAENNFAMARKILREFGQDNNKK